MKKMLIIILTCMVSLVLDYTTVKAEGIAGIEVALENISPEDLNKILNIKYMWTTTKAVNLRSDPNISSNIIVTLNKRSKVIFLKEVSGKWIQVKYNDQVGYIYSKYLRDTELPSLNFTDEEIDLIAKIVWLESRGETDEGEAAVIIIIINRLLSLEFSDTIYDILSDKNQFSTWKLINTAKPTEREYEIINEVLNDEWDDLLDENYVYFSTSPRNNNGTVKIGNHYFCKYDSY